MSYNYILAASKPRQFQVTISMIVLACRIELTAWCSGNIWDRERFAYNYRNRGVGGGGGGYILV